MEARILKGFRDYGPEEMVVRQELMARVARVFESFGYLPLHTPALEYADILLGKYGDEGEKLLYKFEDNGGRMVALRYDLTVPLARFIAMNPHLRLPFRRYQIAPVWRAERPQKGRFREFYQCDIDLVGIDSAAADAECILVDVAVMRALGMEGFTVKINHRGFLDGLLAALGIGAERVVPVMRTLDKVDKVDSQELAEMLRAEGLSELQAMKLVGLNSLPADNAGALSLAATLAGEQPAARAAIARLREVLALVEAAEPGAPVRFVPAIARGLDYYTGIVYETFLPPRCGVGSVMSGGRYDDLLGTMAAQQIPAVGISLGIDRLLTVLMAGRPERGGLTRVLVCAMAGSEEVTARTAAQLRRELPPGCNQVELYPQSVRLKKQFEYADKRMIPCVVVVGPEEAQRGEAVVKWLDRGKQQTVRLEKLAAAVADGSEAVD